MAQDWWRRLPAEERREYQRSERISRVELQPDATFAKLVGAIERSLAADDPVETERASQALVNLVARGLGIPTADISVQGQRPPDGDGELHGIYRPAEGPERDRISVWMRTAKRMDVVATRTFLRTLLHEVGHHIDMRLLDLPNSYHSKGFYQRESSLFRVITRGTALEPGSGRRRSAEPPPPAPAEPKTDVQLGLRLLRAAVDDIAARKDKP